MAIRLKKIGNIEIDNDVECTGDEYTISYWDVRDTKNTFQISIPRTFVEEAFNSRGLSRGVFSYYYGDDEEPHDLTFQEWEENADYRDEFDSLVQTLAIEQLNLHLIDEMKEQKDINLRLLAQRLSLQEEIDAKDREIERLKYLLSNPKIKKIA